MAWHFHWFQWLIVGEVVVSAAAYWECQVAISHMHWPSAE
jgi:hypothetical protein